jgi:signal-transduction protein with cAMP-binding, CBS, and nucleotidyltransferase domain
VLRIQTHAKDYCTVNSIMTSKVIAIDINSSLEAAYILILNTQVQRIFITQQGLLVGVLTAMDILRIIAQ